MITGATTETAGLAAGIGNFTIRGFSIGITRRASWNTQVIPVTIQAVQMIRPVSSAAIEFKYTAIQLGSTDIAILDTAAGIRRHLAGNTVVYYVDHAADGSTPIQQS